MTMSEEKFLEVSNVFKAYGEGDSRQEVLRGMDSADEGYIAIGETSFAIWQQWLFNGTMILSR